MPDASVQDCSSDVQIQVTYTTETSVMISSFMKYFNENDVNIPPLTESEFRSSDTRLDQMSLTSKIIPYEQGILSVLVNSDLDEQDYIKQYSSSFYLFQTWTYFQTQGNCVQLENYFVCQSAEGVSAVYYEDGMFKEVQCTESTAYFSSADKKCSAMTSDVVELFGVLYPTCPEGYK